MVEQIPTALPIGHEGERALTTAVEVARRLVHSRLAWLTLPIDNSGRMQLAAASEAPIDAGCGTILRSPLTLPTPRRQRTADVLRKIRAECASTSIALLRDEEEDGLDDLAPDNKSHISVPVLLDSGGFGLLHVAEPLGKRAFGDDERIALQAHATFIADHLALTAMTRRVQELQGTVHQLQRAIIEVQEEERDRIARDLHDETGHILTAAIIRLDIAERGLTPDAPTHAALRQAREGLVNCADSLHRTAFNLRPQILDDLGLAAALRSLIKQATELDGLQITLITEGRERRLSDALELTVFRVVQEGLTNIRKHAGATRVQIQLNYAARWLTLQIIDNGTGIRRRNTPGRASAGLNGMRERMHTFGGTLTIESRECGGTDLAAKLPLRTHSRKGGR